MANDSASKYKLVYSTGVPVYNSETGGYDHNEDPNHAESANLEDDFFQASFAPPSTVLNVVYWTTIPSSASEIEAWLLKHVTADYTDPVEFYGLFIQWCTLKVQRLKHAKYRWKDGEKDVAERVEAELLFTHGGSGFVKFLAYYQQMSAGEREIPKGKGGVNAVAEAQEKLYDIVFTRAERLERWQTAGHNPDEFDAKTRKKAAKRVEREKSKKLQRIAQGAFEFLHEDYGDVKDDEESGDDDDE